MSPTEFLRFRLDDRTESYSFLYKRVSAIVPKYRVKVSSFYLLMGNKRQQKTNWTRKYDIIVVII